MLGRDQAHDGLGDRRRHGGAMPLQGGQSAPGALRMKQPQTSRSLHRTCVTEALSCKIAKKSPWTRDKIARHDEEPIHAA